MAWLGKKLNQKRLWQSRIKSLREAGLFLGFSVLAIMLVLFILGFIAYAFQAEAATGINQQLNYQGKLTDENGVAVADDTYNIKLAIYDASSGGNCLWTAVGSCADDNIATTTMATVNGIFSVTLGGSSHNSLATSTIDWNSDSLYLGVTIRGTAATPVYDAEMTPRKQLTAAPYAFNTDLIDGIHATSTAAVANQLLALDSFGNLNLFNQGVSSTYATTTWLYVRSDATINTLNATTTNADNLTVFKTGTFNWLSATTSLDYWFNASTTLNNWDYLTNKAATSTILSLLDSDYRLSTLNATTTNIDNLTVFKTGTFNWLSATTSLDYWFNATSTWAGFATNWNSLYNATTTKANLTISHDLIVSGNATTSGNLNVSGYASTTNLVLADGASNLGTYYDMYVSGGNLFFDGTQITGANGASFWKYLPGLEGAISPTSTKGIFINASSTITANFRVDGNATTTGSMYVGQTLGVATTSPFTGMALAVTGDITFDRATTTDRIHIGGTATSTIAGNLEIVGNLGGGSPLDIVTDTNIFGIATVTDHFAAGSTLYVKDSKVGIGITALGQALDVIGNASSSLAIYAGTNMYIGQASNADYDYLYFDAGGQSLLWDNAADRFTLSNDLQVIGAASTTGTLVVNGQTGTSAWAAPTNTLTVVGSGLFTGNATTSGSFHTDQLFVTGNSTSTFAGGVDITGDLKVTSETFLGTVYVTDYNATGNLSIGGNATITNHFEADSTLYVKDSKIGIGTATPATTLNVVGSFNISNGNDQIYTYNSGRGLVLTGQPSGTAFNQGTLMVDAWNAGDTNRALFGLGVAGAQRFKVDVEGDTQIFGTLNVTGTGNSFVMGKVGIGTATPGLPLTVQLAAGDLAGIGLRSTDYGFFASDSSGNLDFIALRQASTNAVYLGDIDDNDGSVILRAGGADALTAINGGNVGIGIAAPVTKLHAYKSDAVADTADGGFTIEQASTGDAALDLLLTGVTRWRIGIDNSDADKLKIRPGFDLTTTATGLTVQKTGEVGIGTASPGVRLEVEYITYDGPIFELQDLDGDCTHNPDADGVNISCSSDARLKTNIRDAQPVLNYILGLPIKDFEMIASGKQITGIVAQDILETYPELVKTGDDGYYMVSSISSWKIIKAIQEQQKLIEQVLSAQSSNDEPITVIDNPDLNTQTLTVQQAATFYGPIYVRGEAGFEHKVVFNKDIEVKGKIYASKDQAGTATIPANATSTEIMFASEYEVAPKITISPRANPLTFSWVNNETTKGFRINIGEAQSQAIEFNWIALAVKSDGIPPVINNFITSLDTVGFNIPVELWVQVSDPDTAEPDLSYSWDFEPKIGSLSGNTGLVYWTVADGVESDTDVTITVTISDGNSSVSDSKVVRVIVPQKEKQPEEEAPTVVSGCTDETALNYNPEATEDDGLCEEKESSEEIVTELKLIPEEEAVIVDTDNDGLSDETELSIGTNPLLADTDNDGYSDGEEIKNNYNPLGEGELAREETIVESEEVAQSEKEEPEPEVGTSTPFIYLKSSAPL